jgi:hypothetical protein
MRRFFEGRSRRVLSSKIKKQIRAAIEPLEVRQLLAIVFFNASGADAASIASKISDFKSQLGGSDNGSGGSFSTGFRTANWDSVPDSLAAPNILPANYYNNNDPRGLLLSTSGTGFQVSADASNPTSTPVRFGNINATYPATFTTNSSERLLTSVSGNQTTVTFAVPGTNLEAGVTGFGMVMTDVDNSDSSLHFFGTDGSDLGMVAFAPASNGLSFEGAFDFSGLIGKVVITAGNSALGPNDAPPATDVVAMDDMIFGEPQSLYDVTNTNDTGPGSLRQALTNVNAAGGGTPTVTFHIPGTGVHTINVLSELPALLNSVIIDGYTQPGSSPNTLAQGTNAVLDIQLSGQGTESFEGLQLTSFSTVRGLVVNKFFDGIVAAGRDVVTGNFVGTDPTGKIAQPNAHGILLGNFSIAGGVNPADRNLASGNEIGILADDSDGAVIQGNLIGTDATGKLAVPNTNAGVSDFGHTSQVTIGGIVPGAANVISGNLGDGIGFVHASQSIIEGNKIGTDVTGAKPLGNLIDGISLDMFDNIVGGLAAGANIIAYNGSDGVELRPNDTLNTGNSIRYNSIHDNGLLGIEFTSGNSFPIYSGIRPNDPQDTDTDGVNSLFISNNAQNYPVLLTATNGAAGTTIIGNLNSNPNTALVIDLYSNASPSPNGFGQGQTWIGLVSVVTGADGNAPFSITVPTLAPGTFISSTATTLADAPTGSTSEFSQDTQVTGPTPSLPPPAPPTLSINNVTMNEGNSGTTNFVFTVTRSGDLTGTSDVFYSTANGNASAGTDYTAIPLTKLHFNASQASAQVTVKVTGDTAVESDETFTVKLSNPTNATITNASGTGTIKNDDSAPPPPPASKVSIITDPCDSTKTAVEIDGTNNNDTIAVTKSGSAQGKVVVKINNVVKGTFSFTGGIVVHALSGNDNISIDSAITRQTLIFGEAGNDTVSGGGGSDVIVGGDGNDKLTGNAGRDLLFGGNNSDSLNGGADDDLLDAGTTHFDIDIASLCKLQDEWVRTDKTYAQRVTDITSGGGLNGSVELNKNTTFSSTTLKDTLTGGSGNDLFFAASTGDILSDKASGETVVKIG